MHACELEAVTQLQPLFGSLNHQVRVQTAVTASKGQQWGDVQVRDYLQHNGVDRDLVFDLSITHAGGRRTTLPRTGKLRHLANFNKPLREAAQESVNKYQHTYGNDHNIPFMPAIFSTSGRIDAEFLRLLFYPSRFLHH